MKRFPVFVFLGLGLALLTVAPSSRADPWNKKTVFDFPRPVEVPGAVLQPGRYVFKLVDSLSNRNIVMISNERENHVYATVLAIPDYRLQPSGKTILTFYEMPEGQPEAVRSWFYPGDNYGREFTYSKKRALQISQASHVVPAPPEPVSQLKTREPEVPAQTAQPEVAKAEQPRAEETPSPEPAPAPAEPEAQPEQAATPTPTPTPAPSAARELPATASNLPLLGLVGLLALGSALAVRFIGARLAE